MNSEIFSFLKKHCSAKPKDVDRLIISAFLVKNNLVVDRNIFLKEFIITPEEKKEFVILTDFLVIVKKELSKFHFEELIELFEFVISPSDRIVSGAIYTPLNIREYIIKQCFKSKENILNKVLVADVACGCGGFLFNAAKELKRKTGNSYSYIFKNMIFGLDIKDYSITRTKLLLNLLALSEGDDQKEYRFNLFVGDALSFNWHNQIEKFKGFNIILGNPPYVCSRNIGDETKVHLKKWEVCSSGHPDLYIPFFQIGIESLATNGILGFITMNTFFKSLNGRALRNYFQNNSLKFKIIDFGEIQIFKSRNTYTCICLIENDKSNFIKYLKYPEAEFASKHIKGFHHIQYSSLESKKGWNMQNIEIITKIESTGTPFGQIYKTRTGIATLKNNVYIFKPIKEDRNYFYLQQKDNVYKIEKGICKDVINSNKTNSSSNLKDFKEKIIFPYEYNGSLPQLLDEEIFQRRYPNSYAYLEKNKSVLAERDKGKGKKGYPNWYAFGRTQSLDKMKFKLFFPQIADKIPMYIINQDEDLLFYNGLAIIGGSRRQLIFIKKLMESKLFWFYVVNSSKPYAGKFYSLSSNYIKHFGICKLTEAEIESVVNESDREVLDNFFEGKYNIKLP